MDFFQHQDEARKSSNRLVVLFALAVLGIVLSVYFSISALFYWGQASASGSDPNYSFNWFDLDRLVFFAGSTLLVILLGSLYKTWRLSDGGHSIAQLLGGRPLSPNTTDPHERRVLNVVEEMAIASGVPVPTVYLMDGEQSINAFAAGFTPQDAVIGVTRGTIELLNRDELQGVIAHEFSHIFNGDMRLNLRLMGVLHGILVIALIGYFILRTTMFRGSSRGRNGGAAALPLIGLVLVILGYVGVFFGRMIKSAVSRQREYLADASAVQFTRNPDGIGRALKKIGGLAEGSVIMSPNAEQASHFFFSDGKYGKVRAALSGVSHFAFLSTHPPIKDRIRRIDRGWNGRFLDVDKSSSIQPESVTQKAAKATGEEKMAKLFKLLPLHLTALVGTLDQDHLTYAHKLLAGIPEEVHKAVREPSAARAVVLALLAYGDAEIRTRQLRAVRDTQDAALVKETEAMVSLLGNAPRETRLPLVDLLVPALRRLSPAQYGEFMNLTDVFIKADQQIDLFEYTLMHVLSRHLEPTFKRVKPPRVEYYGLAGVRNECSVLLSAIAHTGHKDENEAMDAFATGAKELEGITLEFVPRAQAGLAGAKAALEKLDKVSPKLKKELMRAFIASVVHDGKVTVGEGELLRTIADALSLPMPPFLPGQEIDSSAIAS